MTSESTSPIRQIGPLAIRFRSNEPALTSDLDRCYAEFDPVELDGAERAVDIAVEVQPGRRGSPGYEIRVDGAVRARAASTTEVELHVTREINRLVLDAETDHLHLHAGAVERDDVAAMIIGPSGSGKSTLVAWLVTDGWRLLSDEQLRVLPDGRLVPFPRPVTLRRRSWTLIPGVEVDPAEPGLGRVEVPVAQLGAAYSGEPITPAAIVTPDLSTEASSVEHLTAAETMLLLVADTLDLGRAGHAGIETVVALAAAANGWRIAGRDLATTGGQIERCLQHEVPGAPTDHSVTGTESLRSADCHAWLFPDDSAALWEPADGTLLALDARGFEAWEQLAHGMPNGAAGSPFIDALAAAGFVMP